MTVPTTYVIKCKCINCGLHFAAYSWSDIWRPEHCPECGEETRFLVWQEQSDRFIFEHIPGDAPMVAAGLTGEEGQ